MPWLLSLATKARDLPHRLIARSVGSAVAEMAGTVWFLWGLHEVWAPLVGLVGGPIAVLVGVALDAPRRDDTS